MPNKIRELKKLLAQAGFLATKDSEITKHVLDILDGGELAMDLRYKKYGSKQIS